MLSEWHEGLILPGNNGTHERLHAWRSANIILLLLSADYLASTDYTSQELQEAVEHHRAGQTRVIPILIRPCDWQSSILAQPQLQCLPRNGIPVTKWDDRDEALLSVAQEIRHFITTRQTSGIPLTQDQRTNRQRLLRHIRRIWIDGYLEQSLQHAVWIDLHLQKEPDSMERSWGLMVQELDRGPRRLPPGTSMLQVLEEADEELLILGDPGSGKTTLLLYLARTLLDRAEADEGRRIPVVFNLSSWSEQKLPLDQWQVAELKVRYQVPAKIGQAWIENNQIFPLLDGLDEVAESARAACVQAIIAYTQHSLDRSPLILCCRTQEYRALTQPPPTSYATMLLPFTDEQMEVYLSSISGPVDTLREALREDPELFELAHRPLMLSIFAQAYQDATPANFPPTDQPQDYPQMLFRHYVKHMLTRRGRLQRATEEQMLAWLTYFATQLYQQQRTMFAVEELQPFWLPERYRPIYRRSPKWNAPISPHC